MRTRTMLRALVLSLSSIRRVAREQQRRAEHVEACATCGERLYGSDLYMLADPLWHHVCERARVQTTALLCLNCASLHAGRAFRLEDFSPAPINRTVRVVWWFAAWPRERRGEA